MLGSSARPSFLLFALLCGCADERPYSRAEAITAADGRLVIVAGSEAVFTELDAVLSTSTTLTRWVLLAPPPECVDDCVLDLAAPGSWIALGMRDELRPGIATAAGQTRGEISISDGVMAIEFEYAPDGQLVYGYSARYPFFRE